MWTHEVKLEKYQALVPGGGPLRLGTSESQGNEQLRITLGEGWEGRTVRVVFWPCKITKMVPKDGVVDVPWEATKNPLTAAKGKIVFRGLSDDGRIINTLDLPYCVEGHSPTSGQEENQYTPGLVDQLVQQVKEDSQAARQAAKDADAAQDVAAKNADAAAKSSENAAASAQEAKETAAGIESQTKKYADAAESSAQEAKETADGIENQTKKYADAAESSAQAAENSAAKAEAAAEELGQIAKDGPVVSVNGKTGRVQLEAKDLPFDNMGTPFLARTVQDAIEELLLIGGGGAVVSVIRVTAPAGAVVTVQKGAKVYTQTVGSDGAELSFMVLETGTWEVSAAWNDLLDSRTINVAEAGGTYSVVLDFAPFRAFIHVTARAGAVVTASKGELVVSDTVTGSDVTLTVSDKGQWTLSATYDGGNAVPVVVDVQEEETTYEAQLHFLVLTVTAPAGAEVTAAKDGDTIQKTAAAGRVDLYLTGPGLWTVSAAYDGAASQQVTVDVNAGQDAYTAEPAFATLEVTAPEGSAIQARNGQTVLTKTADAGSVLFYLPALGTWDLTASLGDKQASGSVDCLAYQKYTASLSYFEAYIKVIAPEGAAVKATKGDAAAEGTAGPEGAILTVEEAGEWEITATYAGGIAQPVTVHVLASGETYATEPAFATLEVTAPAGSAIQARNGQVVLTKTAEAGSVLFYLPALGTWTLTATLDGQTATGSVDCPAYQKYTAALAYFAASIKAAAVQEATVTAALDGYSVSGEAGSDGTVTLAVTKPGSYTVSAAYSGASSNRKSVQVSQSGQQYTVSVEFITLTVTAPEGSTITAQNGATTLTDTGGTVKFYLPNTGSWTITAELDGQTASSAVEASDYKDYPVTLAYVYIYGASWDGTSTTKWTRTDDSAGFVDPVPYVQGASSYSSPFDNLQPWAGMVKSERTGGTMVAIPKFWYELKQNGNGMTIRIATGPIEGFSVSPAHMDRGDGKGERDVVYIGRYHCGASSHKSTSGQLPYTDITRSQARSTIHGLGANIWQMDFAMRFTIWLLYIVEFADWNSQAKIGYGCSPSGSKFNMGATDGMAYHTGTTVASRTSYGCCQYRNIEGLWDNVYDWMDGCYYNGNGLNIILNPNSFSDSSGGVSVGTPSSGYPSKFSVKTTGGFPLFIPTAASGSDSTYSCDGWYFYSSYPCLFVGGYYNQNASRGLFCVDGNSVSSSDSNVGCRLHELP